MGLEEEGSICLHPNSLHSLVDVTEEGVEEGMADRLSTVEDRHWEGPR